MGLEGMGMTPIATITNFLFGELAKNSLGFYSAQFYLLSCFNRGLSATGISMVPPPPFFRALLHSTALYPVTANTQTWPFQSSEVGTRRRDGQVLSLADACH